MSQILTPRHAIIQYLRNAAPSVPLVEWGDEKSPFFIQAQPPIPAFPYVTVTIPPSSIEHSTEQTYVETYKPEIEIAVNQDTVDLVSGPMVPGSVFYYLDALAAVPGMLDGAYHTCEQFTRDSYVVEQQEQRDGDSVRTVYVAKAVYTMICNQNYPILTQ